MSSGTSRSDRSVSAGNLDLNFVVRSLISDVLEFDMLFDIIRNSNSNPIRYRIYEKYVKV